jgi:tetratricopeptide (TPR) repeat protein
MGLGLLDIDLKQFEAAKVEFHRAVDIAEEIAEDPERQDGHPGLIEAYLQLGRAYHFGNQLVESEICFRRMQDLAADWVSVEPGNEQAKDLLASSYRKLGDLRKFALDFKAAREAYLTAIKIGEELLQHRPDSFPYKTHLAIALDDLGGIARDQGAIPEARQRFERAVVLFSELVQSDPENLETRIWVMHTQLHLGRLEADQLQFEAAAELYRTVLDQANQLSSDGRLDGRRDASLSPRALTADLAACKAAPRALADVEFARSQRPVVAARLLVLRAKRRADVPKDPRRLTEFVESLLGLNSQDPEDQHDLARQIVAYITALDSAPWPASEAGERQSLRERCADRAVDLLVQSVEHGSADAVRAESGEFALLKAHPGYQALVASLKKSPGPQDQRINTPE